MSAAISLGIATLFTAVALLLVSLSFSLDFWLRTVVDREKLRTVLTASTNATLNTDPNTFTRNRGLFKECYHPFMEAKFLDSDATAVEGKCRPIEYEIPEKEAHLTWGTDYWTMIHLRRAHFGVFVAAIILLIIGSFSGAIGCWRLRSRILKATSILVFLGALCIASGMALFHGTEYLERNKVKDPQIKPGYYASLTDPLKQVTMVPVYSYSYGLGWAGMGAAIIAAITYLCASHQVIRDNEKSEKKALDEQNKIHQRNRAYEMMDGNGQMDDYGYGGQPYGGPYNTKGGPYPGYDYDAWYNGQY